MKRFILSILFLILQNGVSGFETDGVKSLSVMEGDSLPLYTCLNDIQKYDNILWTYGSENAIIAKFNKGKPFSFPPANERFTDRLDMDLKSGSLTIRNIRTNHSGIYKVEMISKSGSPYLRKFNVTVVDVFDPHADKISQKLAKEGDSVTLSTDTKVQKDVLILWKFTGTKPRVYSKNDVTTIGKVDGETSKELFDLGENEKFKNRLKIDQSTGSLTITDIGLEHAGFYILQINNNTATRYRSFNITVSAVAHSCLEQYWKPVAIVSIVLSVGMVILLLALGIKKIFFSKKKKVQKDTELIPKSEEIDSSQATEKPSSSSTMLSGNEQRNGQDQ